MVAVIIDVPVLSHCAFCMRAMLPGLREVLALREGDEIVQAACEDCRKRFEVQP
jgi:hypothetical protein